MMSLATIAVTIETINQKEQRDEWRREIRRSSGTSGAIEPLHLVAAVVIIIIESDDQCGCGSFYQ